MLYLSIMKLEDFLKLNFKQLKMKKTNLDKIILVTSAALALDAIITPFFTGKTIHEYLGAPSAKDYELFGETNALMAERVMWGVATLYCVGVEKYKSYKSLK